MRDLMICFVWFVLAVVFATSVAGLVTSVVYPPHVAPTPVYELTAIPDPPPQGVA